MLRERGASAFRTGVEDSRSRFDRSPAARKARVRGGEGPANSTDIPQTSRHGRAGQRRRWRRGRGGLSHRCSSFVASLAVTVRQGTNVTHCPHRPTATTTEGLETIIQNLSCPLSSKPAWLSSLAGLTAPPPTQKSASRSRTPSVSGLTPPTPSPSPSHLPSLCPY